MSNEAVPDAWPDYELIISNDLINYDVLHKIVQFTVLVKTLWFLNVLINEVSYLNAYQGCIYVFDENIRMISEGSCDTENWSNCCWKFSFTSQK